MRKLQTIVYSALCVFLFSCQQEIDDVLTNPPGNNNNNNNNNNASGGLYQPLTSGTWWKYRDSTSSTLSTLTATPVTKTFNGINYRAVTSGNGDTAYMGVQGPNYFMRVAGMSPSGAPYDITFNYLNDTASVGYTWQYNSGQGNGFTAISQNTIVAKGLTLSIEGKTYTDVIQTSIVFSYVIAGSTIPYAEYEYYVGKNVGIVRTRADLGVMQTCSNLVDHHVQ